jgi:hypothetical protein
MRLWDRGRVGEFGFDIRGGRLHRLAEWLFRKDVPQPPFKKLRDMSSEELAMHRRSRRQACLSCFCEPCVRELFFPWPFNW